MEAQAVTHAENDACLRERKISNSLNNATAIGQVISKEALWFDNNLNIMVLSGGKGSFTNIAQITGMLGQQNIEGGRIPLDFGGRTLPHYTKGEMILDGLQSADEVRELSNLYESRGFVSSNYIHGLNVKEFFFHAAAGRIGIIDTGLRTAQSGYIQRKLVKKMENYKISYSGFVTDSLENVLQFNYENNLDPARVVKAGKHTSFADVKSLINGLNTEVEWKHQTQQSIEKLFEIDV